MLQNIPGRENSKCRRVVVPTAKMYLWNKEGLEEKCAQGEKR